MRNSFQHRQTSGVFPAGDQGQAHSANYAQILGLGCFGKTMNLDSVSWNGRRFTYAPPNITGAPILFGNAPPIVPLGGTHTPVGTGRQGTQWDNGPTQA